MAERTKATEYEPGVKSAMRIIALAGTIASIFVVVFGCMLALVEVLRATGTNQGFALAGVGLGMFTSGAIGKAWQAQAEAKSEAAEGGTV